MARRCEFTGKDVQVGNNVSHANNKTKRRFLPNLHHVTLFSAVLKRGFRFRISANALRTVDKVGGIDEFLLNPKNGADLSPNAQWVRVMIALRVSEESASESTETAVAA